MERGAGGGPRIYVPIGMPDHASQPTYAVLEFVGFSSPAAAPSAGPHHLLSPAPIASLAPAPPPAMLCLPPAPSSSAAAAAAAGPAASFYPLPPAAPPCHAIMPATPLLPVPPYPAADSNALLLPSHSRRLPPPSHSQQQYRFVPAHPYASSNPDSPPSSPPSLALSSASSASRESCREKHRSSSGSAMAAPAPKIDAKPIVCFGPSVSDSSSVLVTGSHSPSAVNFPSDGAHPCASSAAMGNYSRMTERGVVQTNYSVSQTERETIVHTNSSNFRDVVRQLTGASSDDQALLPVTLPARLANRVNNASMMQSQNNACAEMGTSGAGPGRTGGSFAGTNGGGLSTSRDQLGLRKAPLKLHERRKSTMKNLEKVTSAYSLHGAAEVSPIMNPSPVTPLASDFERCCNASTPSSQGSSAGLSSPVLLLGKAKDAMEAAAGRAAEQNQQQESGCFFSFQRPPPSGARRPSSPMDKPAPPTLLSLFPESPASSPHAP